MLVSLNEIKKVVDISDLTAEQIAERLTDAGVEVEDIKVESTATNLVIGQVLSCENHPESDHLHICKVDIGTDVLDIVCGAPNVRKGLKVIVALVGAKLPGGEIKKSVIRGQESNGMLCSLLELGVSESFLTEAQINGIEELKDDAKVGDKEVLKYLNLDDKILNLKVLANRSDCMSLHNVAREIAGLFKKEIKLPEFKDNANFKADFVTGSESENSKCFKARVFKNIKVKESPEWLKVALRREGIRSINNIVDIGNYAMLLTGQPVHMYDLDKLEKNELIVKDDLECEVVALDGKTYKVEKGDLVVTSNNKPVCLAGVMGLECVEVNEESKNIVLEVASFNGTRVRKTSLRLGLSSDSSSRFIKGINIENQDYTMLLISNLMAELADAKEISETISYDVQNHEQKVINCNVDFINNLLGTDFSFEEIKDTLEALSFKVNGNKDEFKVTVPSYRIDVEGKADLAEEVIRYNGFDRIIPSLPVMETTTGGRSATDTKIKAIEDYLLNNGLNEIISYTLLNEKDSNSWNYLNKFEPYVILNPLTEDHKYVRRNLLKSMLNTVEYNLAHLNRNFGLFEIGNCETKEKNEIHLAVGLSGVKEGQELYKSIKYDVFDAKGILENILRMFNIADSRVKYDRIEGNEFHPYRSMNAYLDNKLFAVLGEVHPSVKEEFNFNKDACVLMEINLSRLFEAKTRNNKSNEISIYPRISRDYAFVISKDVNYSNIVKEIKKASSLIKGIKLFDLYEGEHIMKGFISIALTVECEKQEGTFTNDEITVIDNKIREIISTKLGAKIRG